MMLMLAGGGEACTDIEALRSQDVLFGSVPPAPTLWRTIRHRDHLGNRSTSPMRDRGQ